MKNDSSIFYDAELKSAKDALIKTNSPAANKAFAETFAKTVNEGNWVLIPVHENDSLFITEHYASLYVAICTSKESTEKTGAAKVYCADINKIIDALYGNPHFTGLVLDPADSPVYVSRKQISGMTNRKDPRAVRKDWGEGIPQYAEDDLLSAEEIQDFGIEVVTEYGFEKEGYHVTDVNPGIGFAPSIVAEKDGKIFFVLVESSILPDMPSIGAKKEQFCSFCHQHGAIPVYAAVGFGAADEARFNASLALYGDGFYSNFKGLEILD